MVHGCSSLGLRGARFLYVVMAAQLHGPWQQAAPAAGAGSRPRLTQVQWQQVGHYTMKNRSKSMEDVAAHFRQLWNVKLHRCTLERSVERVKEHGRLWGKPGQLAELG